MPQKAMIAAVLGAFAAGCDNEYFYDATTDEVWYWDGEYRVCTPFDEFVAFAYDRLETRKQHDAQSDH